MSGAEDLLLVGAGLLAGVVGSAGGITSLVAFPALLAVGLAPFVANVTQSVAFVVCLPGSALGSRPELRDALPPLRRPIALVVTGAACGATLLIALPSGDFAVVVPYLVMLGSLALLGQPLLTRWRAGRRDRSGREVVVGPARYIERLAAALGMFLVACYDGYFGAGAGVMMLTLLLVSERYALPRANALKNLLLGVADVAVAIAFTIFASIHWGAALPLAIGLFPGARLGPAITRRVPESAMRAFAASAGVALAAYLWATSG